MPELLGNVTVPEVTPSGIFPLTPDWPVARSIEPVVVVHGFQSANAKIEQRFLLGDGARRWQLSWRGMTQDDLEALKDFWDARRGPYQPFTIALPADDGQTMIDYTVRFENAPLSWENFLAGMASAQITVVEEAGDAPTYSVEEELDRFPNTELETALTAQVQVLIPLLKIVPKETDYPPILIADRKLYLASGSSTAGDLYHARLISWSGIQQSIGGQSDQAQFVLGDADRAITALSADVDLFRASIEFSLYHVGTATKLDLWKGEIDDFDQPNPDQFSISAVDGLYALTLQYPVDKVSQLCWKQFDDGAGCPFASSGSLDLVNFPTASAGSCDHGYHTANGCRAHGMKRYFGGIVAEPQSVSVKDNSTGHFGIGRSTATATSLVSDSLLGQPLAEVYTDTPYPVDAALLAGRDEGDFYEAVGLVGAGPIGAFGRGQFDNQGNRLFHTLDGQPNHGDPGSLGLREILGTDPAGATDFLSLDQSGNQVNGDPKKIYSGSSTYLDQFAAGVAAVVIRRADQKGFQLTTLDEHKMRVWVYQGLSGWIWTAPGARAQGALTNPIWLAVNVYLRGIGLRFSTIEEAEAVVNIPSAVAMAAICDLTVAKLIGEGSETQFKFQGVIRDIKVLRDWLQEILNNCLGNFYFENGKLTFSIRQDAAAAHSFTDGNMIANSLRLSPIRPEFNRLTVAFANRDYNFVLDTIGVQDLDHVDYVKRVLNAELNLAGAAGKSMAGRIGAARLKEELGGVGLAEWRAARRAAWSTTVLALGVAPGQGVSITHDDVPGGSGLFRVTSWVLNPDMSISVEGRTITDSMYSDIAGPKAADVDPNPVPPEFFPFPLKSAWLPNYAAPPEGDAFANPYDRTFGLSIEYGDDAGGVPVAFARVAGYLPVNRFIPNALPPIIRSQSQSTSGGSLKGGKNYWAQVFAKDASGMFTPGSNIRHFTFENVGTDNNSITVGDIQWPAGSFSEFLMFVGDDEKVICEQEIGGGSVGTDTGSGSASGFTCAGPIREATYNAPSPAHQKVRAKAKRLVHGGAIGTQITDVDQESGTITLGSTAGLGDDWTDRWLYCAARRDAAMPVPAHYLITAYNETTGEMTLDPVPEPGELFIGDVVYIRLRPTTFSSYVIGDEKLANGVYPAGAETDAEVGYVIRAYKFGYPNQVRRIVANTSTTYTVDEPFLWEPDFFCVEVAMWEYQADSTPVPTPTNDVETFLSVPIANLLEQPVTVGVFMVDRLGNETPEEYAIIRDSYVFGSTMNGPIEREAWLLGACEALAVAEDVTNRRSVKAGGQFFQAVVNAKQPSTAGRVVLDILQSEDDGETWTSIFPDGNDNKVVIPEGFEGQLRFTSFAQDAADGALLRPDILEAGTDCAKVVLEVQWREHGRRPEDEYLPTVPLPGGLL